MKPILHSLSRQMIVSPGILLLLVLAACATYRDSGEDGGTAIPTQSADVLPQDPTSEASDYEELEIVTLLPRDAIPAIDDPQFLDRKQADEVYEPTELVLGVDFNGDTRAYSVPLLSRHEIVNDTVGGVKIAVTW